MGLERQQHLAFVGLTSERAFQNNPARRRRLLLGPRQARQGPGSHKTAQKIAP
jgi:hypothetical protein